jgi:phosphatidylinositol-3-phosphatase
MEFLTVLVLALAFSNPLGSTVGDQSHANHPFNYVVVIVMENQGLGDIIHNPVAPFLNQLASSYSLATNYTAINHPSLPNYLSLVSGLDFGSWSKTDCNPGPVCSAGDAPNIVDSLENRGLSWKAYMEDYPSSCGSHCSPGNCFVGDTGTGQYAARHDPFVYFDDIVNSTARCARIVPANSGGNDGQDDLFLSDLASPSTASNLMWLTPNLCNDMHSSATCTNGCTSDGNPTCLKDGDSYLSSVIPQILSSNLFTHQKAALFVTFDEGNGFCPLDGSSEDCVYAVWAGPVVKTNFQSANHYSHYSFLKTLETNWRLPSLTSNDGSATPMTDFFVSHLDNGHGEHERSDDDHSGVNAEDHSVHESGKAVCNNCQHFSD